MGELGRDGFATGIGQREIAWIGRRRIDSSLRPVPSLPYDAYLYCDETSEGCSLTLSLPLRDNFAPDF